MIAAAAVAVAFSFSRYGGNIVPYHARITTTGRIMLDGRMHGRLTEAQLAALRRAIDMQRFGSLPPRITCTGVLPDVATRSVTARNHRVTARGACNRRFERVYAALTRAARVQ